MAAQPPSNSQPSSSNRNALPFEPKKNRKSPDKKPAKSQPVASAKTEKKGERSSKTANSKPAKAASGRSNTLTSSGIPEVVSKRMVRRMALFCGVPTALGISTFITSYFLVSNDLVKLPTVAVLLVSLGFFGLGVLGLSYGALSASWEEETPGSALGFSEFRTNLGRTVAAWRSPKPKS